MADDYTFWQNVRWYFYCGAFLVVGRRHPCLWTWLGPKLW